MIKDENDYLKEWITHHMKIGIKLFYIYDNNSKVPITKISNNVVIKTWDLTQIQAYKDCCITNQELDYIGFLDTDEFYVSKSMDINKDFENLLAKFGKFMGLGLYWRMYGKRLPYYDTRVPIERYTQYFESDHIKSFLNPRFVRKFDDPHYASIMGYYIDENGNTIKSAVGTHTSNNIFIKHIWSRSTTEFVDKISRGSGDGINRNYSMRDFFDYNNQCILT